MARDRLGQHLEEGDEVMVRGKITELHPVGEGEAAHSNVLTVVLWYGGAPFQAHLRSDYLERIPPELREVADVG